MSNDQYPFVSIVIASFNRKDIVEESIKSVINQNYPYEKIEVLLVDNNSSDGTIEEVKSKFSNYIKSNKLKLISLDYNSGSSGSCIEAIKYINDKWKYIFKMDEDIVLDSNCILEMIKMKNKSIYEGMIGGKVLFYKNRDAIHAVGSYLKPFLAIAKGIGVNQKDGPKFKKSKSYDGVSGCMVLIPRSIYEKCGWFDADYFLYYDDHDLMYKSLKNGFHHLYCAKAIGYHDTATGTKKKYANKKWLYYSTRGSLIFLNKNFTKLSFNYFIYFISHNLKFFVGIFYLLFNSKIDKIYENLCVYFLGYFHGLKGVGGFYDIDNETLRILVMCGGRGGQELGKGINNYLYKFNKKAFITYLINCYDDGKSTGKIRAFYNNKILGPSDVRKIHENTYKNKLKDKNIISFFNLRLDLDRKIKKSLSFLVEKKLNESVKDIEIDFTLLPQKLKNLLILALEHFLKNDKDNFNCKDFSLANLVYASLADYYNSMQRAEEEIRDSLKLDSKVILNSDENNFLFALTEDGNLLSCEEEIVNYKKLSPIYEIYITNNKLTSENIGYFHKINNFEEKKYFVKKIADNPPQISNKAQEEINHSDIIIFSPGTQHSSLYPTYFSKNLSNYIRKSKANKFFITNIFVDNEMPGFNSSDQIRQAVFYMNEKNKLNFNVNELVDVLIVNKPDNEDNKYLRINLSSLEQLKLKKYIFEKVESEFSKGKHDSYKLASLILNSFYTKWK